MQLGYLGGGTARGNRNGGFIGNYRLVSLYHHGFYPRQSRSGIALGFGFADNRNHPSHRAGCVHGSHRMGGLGNPQTRNTLARQHLTRLGCVNPQAWGFNRALRRTGILCAHHPPIT